MTIKLHSTPRKDGYKMPAEFSPQQQVFMIWPQRPDNWRNGGKPVQRAFVQVAQAISRFTPVTMLVSTEQFQNAKNKLGSQIRVIEMSNNDAWIRDCGPTFVINDNGDLRAVSWEFNAWGGVYDGLYFPWDKDNLIAEKIADLERIDYYHTEEFVLEGGSFHVDGEGTVLTTEMCLLSPGRNPHMSKGQIEEMLCEYLNAEKVIWLKDGIDPMETNGHIDDVACFARPGEAICIWTDDKEHPFYRVCQDCYEQLCAAADAKGRKLKVHKLTLPKNAVTIDGQFEIDAVNGTAPRRDGDICIASYMNFLITNNGVILPQYGDEYDELAVAQMKEIFPDHEIVPVNTREIVYGGGNIHCVTQHQPAIQK